MDELLKKQETKAEAFSPREFAMRYLKYIPWLIASTALFLVLAFIKLRYSSSIFQVTSKLLIKNDRSSGSQDKLRDLFMTNYSQNLEDEIQVLTASGLSKRIVKALNLQTSYLSIGKVKSYHLHPNESPLWLEIMQLKDSSQGYSMDIKYLNENTVNINNAKEPVYIGQVIENGFAKFRLLKRPVNYLQYGSNLFNITWRPLDDVATEMANTFQVSTVNEYSNVLLISYETENPILGKDIVNQLMQEYNVSSVEDKRIITVNTLAFIDERLDTIKQELSGVEQSLQIYREQNKAINLEQQSVISFNELSQANQTLTQQEVQLKIINYLQNYLQDQKNRNKTVPTSLGITEPSLQTLIQEYNAAELRRETLLQSTKADNPIVHDLDTDIEKLREQIQENLNNIHQAYLINRNNLQFKTRQAETDISSVPGKGRKMLEITRQQKILEDLYSFLLQKRLETSISSASTVSNSKVLEPARASYLPIKPNRKGLFLIATIIGLGIPLAFIAFKEYLNDKITSRYDLEKLTEAPILGEIGHSMANETLVVTKNNRKFISEQFRIIRTNLQYVISKIEHPVILVTSSFSGEGKSFISTNIGAVMALTGKKTVILEFDIRKPKILAGLNMTSKMGITNFIVGNVTVDEIILPINLTENLYVIPCGPIPPNPGELLLDEKVKELFDYLRVRFDTIIIDSAPMGLVSDGIILSAYADATLYITRQNYTLKKQVGLVNDLYTNKKLPKISLLLNDVKATSGYGGYYGSYGYGYSYGQGNDYFEQEGQTKKRRFSRIRRLFTRK